uniref:Peptidase M12B domain-containing protein n=1 Tax=Strigamia maritima TaxID=126957 RepID=T1J214_STRMM
MVGYIWSSSGRFFMEPASTGGDITDVHVIYRYDEKEQTKDNGIFFRHRRHHHRHNAHKGVNDSGSHQHKRRSKRSVSHDLHVEVMVVADMKMQMYHGTLLQNYILTLMSIVSLIYKDASIGNSINIAVVKLAMMNEDVAKDVVHQSAPKTLKNFCKWQAIQNDPNDKSSLHHDTAILLTREDICRSPKKCDTLGLAELGTMCDPYNSCSIVEDNGLSAAFTIAHELGHVLSMPHDDDFIKCHRINNGKQYHVMARMLDYNTYPWSWSTCSSHFLTEFLDSGLAHCLQDPPLKNKLKGRWAEERQPGELFTDDSQCELVYGSGARICPYMPVCKILWCVTPDLIGCRTHHMPWADGTKCGEYKWCQKGECRRREPTKLKPIDGGWSKWNKYGPCSRTCGGGIQKAIRHCNKPKPDNGGRYCIGRRIRYRSCKTQSCGSLAKDFREEQCAAFNGKHFNIHGLPTNVTWAAVHSGLNPKDRCKLFCRVSNGNAYYVLREKVEDGTPCSPDSFDVCVNGICLPAGCDLRLGSKKQLDLCGVCGGNNSTCKTVSGHLNRRLHYGYTDVVRIPAGANNIDVRQYGYNNSEKDDNYIALKTPVDEYILNGNFSVILFKKLIRYGVSTLEYNGAGAVVERINASRPLEKDLIIQVILSVKDLLPPDIHYQYTISTTTAYRWDYAPQWDECSSICQGYRYRQPVCLRTYEGVEVDGVHCWKVETQPQPLKELCNQHCKLSWQITRKSECSAHCGKGKRTLTVQCVQMIESDSRIVDDWFCKNLPDKPSSNELCEIPCTVAQWEFGAWSKCSVSCGRGERQRPYWCELNGKEVHGSMCNPNAIPEHKQTCVLASCPSWKSGQWGQCSSTCGNGVSRRMVICQSDREIRIDDNRCNVREKPEEEMQCNLPQCVSTQEQNQISSSTNPPGPYSNGDKIMWKTSLWGECSTTCGVGFRKRKVECYNEDGKTKNNADECKHLPRPAALELCQHKPCGSWGTGEWSEVFVLTQNVRRLRVKYNQMFQCSRKCGGGYQRRQVVCQDDNGKYADGCDTKRRPEETIHCHSHPCPTWAFGRWGACSVTCGDGIQERYVVCIENDGRVVPSTYCESEPIETQQNCTMSQCPAWKLDSEWSTCTASCNVGMQTRRPFCSYDNQTVEDSFCSGIPPMTMTRSCNTHQCPMRWVTTNWSQVFVTNSCGKGRQTRSVYCINDDGIKVNEQLCGSSKRPRLRRACNKQPCPYTWKTGFWSDCSVTCGPGVQTRTAFCHEVNAYGWMNPDPVLAGCKENERPTIIQSCGAESCTDIQRKLDVREDGEQEIVVRGKRIRVYCGAMNTSYPHEYITLPSGEEENYSEMYERRLIRPDTCPYNGERTESCECIVDAQSRAGFTTFSKIRLNITNLRVIAHDYSFARAIHGQLIPYAEAADCYSSANCPQGRFSINLADTGFIVSEFTEWVGHGNKPSIKILHHQDGLRVQGRCGGYCGKCTVDPLVGLLLDVAPP